MSERLHHLHVTIIAALLLVGCFAALFILQGQISGKATTGSTAYIVESRPMNCTFTVGKGYNLISMPCLSTAVPVGDVINTTPVEAIYQYVPTGNDRWKVYNPNLPAYVVSDLQFMTRRAGYIVLIDAPANITLEGLETAQTDVPIVQGWNLVGYPSNDTREINASLGTIANTTTQVQAYNKSGEAFIIFPGGSLNQTTPGLGYWVNSTAGASWTVNG